MKRVELPIKAGGGRRDEEKARAKERFFSHRNEFGEWDPKNQRPELWNLFNGRKNYGEHFRVFPISNWTEMDVWQYIKLEKIELPSLYFTHKRRVFNREGVWLAESEYNKQRAEEKTIEKVVQVPLNQMFRASTTLSRKLQHSGLPKGQEEPMTNDRIPPWKTEKRKDIFKIKCRVSSRADPTF